jgi:maleate isomerase
MSNVIGALSGKRFVVPDVNQVPMPAIAPPGVIYNGALAFGFGDIDGALAHPDVLSFKRKFGLLIPATNTSMEYELWRILMNNSSPNALAGVGLHVANVNTPKPQLRNEADLLEYKKHFLNGLKAATDQLMFAQPQYLIMGMSLEHIIDNIDEIRAPMAEVEKQSGLSCAAWHDAAPAALRKLGAKRIGLLTPFDKKGNENASKVFTDLGFEVISSVGFSCANALHIAHVPEWAKEKAILSLLATAENKLDAIVQCGTNMSLVNVTERLEPVIGIPILGINAVTFWYALRENGFDAPLLGAGKLLREH